MQILQTQNINAMTLKMYVMLSNLLNIDFPNIFMMVKADNISKIINGDNLKKEPCIANCAHVHKTTIVKIHISFLLKNFILYFIAAIKVRPYPIIKKNRLELPVILNCKAGIDVYKYIIKK